MIVRPLYRKFLEWHENNILEPSLRYTSACLDPRGRMLYYALKFAEMNKVKGDYLEFGVWRGNTFVHACHLARRFGLPMRFYAFDSFEGNPEDREVNEDGSRIFHTGQYPCSLDEFQSVLRDFEVDADRVTIIPGWYHETLIPETKAKLPLKAAAVVWIDCGLYESARPVFEFITDYLVQGSIIIINSWFMFKGDPNHGEQRAFREWLKLHPSLQVIEYNRYWWLGNSFLVQRV